MKKTLLLLLILMITLGGDVLAQAGNLDSSFGTNGRVTTHIYNGDFALAIAMQTDGKILLTGITDTPGPLYNGIPIVRYYPDGTLDSSFGDNGIVITGFDYNGNQAYSIMVAPDGKIVIDGQGGDATGILKFNSDGSVDESFSLIISDSSGYLASAIQPDGKIVATEVFYSQSKFVLNRFNTDGSSDTFFGTNGSVIIPLVSAGLGKHIALQPIGKIIVAGGTGYNTNSNFILARYNSNGTVDSSFGEGGIATTSFDDFSIAYSLNIQSDGKIVAAGITGLSPDFNFALARYLSDGVLDSSFGNQGKMIVDSGRVKGNSVAVQADGKIIVFGTLVDANQHQDFALIRYNGNGTVDSTFGVDGRVVTDFDNGYDEAYVGAIQTDGKILAAGSSSGHIALARYISGLNVGIINLSSPTNSVLIYPNPIEQTATLEYTLKNPETISIRLLDVQGKVLKTFTENESQVAGEHQEEISLPNQLPSGFYFVKISSANGTSVSVKIVK